MTTTHQTGTRDEWLAARIELLKAEKALTRQSDALVQQRQALPWVRIDKAYTFETAAGRASLADLFKGRSQLLVYHFMFGPDYKAGCPSCSSIADGFDASSFIWRITTSRCRRYRGRRWRSCRRISAGWAGRSRGLPRLAATLTSTSTSRSPRRSSAKGSIEYNYERGGHAMDETQGRPGARRPVRGYMRNRRGEYTRDRPGLSAFVLEDGVVYHTYSTYARGVDGIWGMYQWLDRAPKGRNETGVWWKRHDEYEDDALSLAMEHASATGGREMPAHSIEARASQRAFFGVSALLFAVSTAVTIVGAASMSAMGEMPMPGGWTMSAAWMPMCGQTWSGLAASFLCMWVVMMVAMMLPSLVPMLLRYREAVGGAGVTGLGWLTVVVGAGYFFVWTAFGMAAFPLGAALAALEMQQPALARAVPFAMGVIVLIAGGAAVHGVEGPASCLLPHNTWSLPHVARIVSGRHHGMAPRPALGLAVQLLLRRPDDGPARCRGHGSACDGRCDGGHHR